MKKIFSTAMALICALTVAAFGFSACEDVSSVVDSISSDINSTGTADDSSTGTTDSGTTDNGASAVTMAQWMTIMSVANSLLNVTVGVDYTSVTTTYSSAEDISVDYEEMKGVIKTDLTNSTTITGNIYVYEATESSGLINGEEGASYSTTETTYQAYTQGGYSYVAKYTLDGEEAFNGGTEEGAVALTDTDIYKEILSYVDTLAGLYSALTYQDDVYSYSSDAMTVNVALNGLYISYISLEINSAKEEEGSTVSQTETYYLTFSDYGKTAIEVPAEYTYDNYRMNYIGLTEEEWKAALSKERIYNVLLEYEVTSQTENEDGTSNETYAFYSIRTDLVDDDGSVTGTIYSYSDSVYTDYYEGEGGGLEEYIYGGSWIEYDIFGADYYSEVYSYADLEYPDELYFYGYYAEGAQALSYSSYYYYLSALTEYADYYSSFTFEGGVYTAEIEDSTIQIIMKDGYVSEIIVSATYVSEGEYTETVIMTYNFYDYGETSVEVPEEYTYSNYLENNA